MHDTRRESGTRAASVGPSYRRRDQCQKTTSTTHINTMNEGQQGTQTGRGYEAKWMCINVCGQSDDKREQSGWDQQRQLVLQRFRGFRAKAWLVYIAATIFGSGCQL